MTFNDSHTSSFLIFIRTNQILISFFIFNSYIMKVLLDIKDSKAAFFFEVLKNFSFVKATPLTNTKAEFLQGLKEAVDEVKLAKEGKVKTTSLEDFLDEISD